MRNSLLGGLFPCPEPHIRTHGNAGRNDFPAKPFLIKHRMPLIACHESTTGKTFEFEITTAGVLVECRYYVDGKIENPIKTDLEAVPLLVQEDFAEKRKRAILDAI